MPVAEDSRPAVECEGEKVGAYAITSAASHAATSGVAPTDTVQLTIDGFAIIKL